MCEICLQRGIIKTGEIVHHKVELTPENIGDPAITLNPDNLMLVCRSCHEDIHRTKGGIPRPYTIDECGRVIIK